jgi:hypothetical protein
MGIHCGCTGTTTGRTRGQARKEEGIMMIPRQLKTWLEAKHLASDDGWIKIETNYDMQYFVMAIHHDLIELAHETSAFKFLYRLTALGEIAIGVAVDEPGTDTPETVQGQWRSVTEEKLLHSEKRIAELEAVLSTTRKRANELVGALILVKQILKRDDTSNYKVVDIYEALDNLDIP